MTLCPIALVSSCTSCPIVKVCPLKSVIGDYEKIETSEANVEQPTETTQENQSNKEH